MVKKRIGITIRFTVEDFELIQEFAKQLDIPESTLIRMAVKEYIRNRMMGQNKRVDVKK
jgi:hypothetical protein